MTEAGGHYELITHVTYVRDGDPWPIEEGGTTLGVWSGYWKTGNQKVISIEPCQRHTGSLYETPRLAVWWMEKAWVQDAPPLEPELSDYEKVREELQV